MKQPLCRCLLPLKKGSLFLSSTSALLCPFRPSWNSIPFHIKDLEILPDGLYQGTAAWGQARTRWSPLATFLARNWLLENSHPHQITELHVGLPSNKPDSQVGQLRKPSVCTHKYTPRDIHSSSRKPSQIAPVLGSCTITPNDSFDELQQTFPGVI